MGFVPDKPRFVADEAPSAKKDQIAPFEPSGEKTSGWLGGIVGFDPKALGITPAENIAAHPLTRFATGAGSLIGGGAQLGLEAVGADEASKWLTERLKRTEELKQTGMKAMGAEGIDFAGTAGAVAGGVAGLAKLGITGVNTALKSATLGGGLSAMTPVMDTEDFWKTKAIQTSIGAAFGGLVPIAIRGAMYLWDQGKNVLLPMFGEAGKRARAGKLLADLAGDDKTAIEKLIAENKMHVPHSQATATELAAPSGRAEFVALQNAAKAVKPTGFDRIAKAQEAARLASVQKVGKDSDELLFALHKRAVTAAQNYGASADDVVMPATGRIKALFERPSMASAMKRAKTLVEEAGEEFGSLEKGFTVKDMQAVKMALDDVVSDPKTFGIGGSEAAAVMKTRGEFLNWLSTASPKWELARNVFARQSKAINEMQVGQELEKALTKPIGVGERPTVFAGAMREAPRTMKRATGQPRFEELDEVLRPENLARVKGVLADLSRKAEAERLAGLGAQKASKIESPFGLPATGPLHREYMIFKTVLGRVTRGMTDETIDMVADAIQIPAETLKLLQQAPASAKSEMVEKIAREWTLKTTSAGAVTSARGVE